MDRKKRIISKLIVLSSLSALLGAQPLDADAFILEAVYSDIIQAVENRVQMRLGETWGWLSPLLYWQVPLRLDIPLGDLRPVKAIARVDKPLFIIGGSQDLRTTVHETQSMYDSANSKHKKLWIVDGARHQDFYRYSPAEYERQIGSFISLLAKGE